MINPDLIPQIEEALAITLYKHQFLYLVKGVKMYTGRNTGKTLAYCINLALSEGPPIDLKLPELYCDSDYGTPENKVNYSRWFRGFFREIHSKLEKAGLPVRGIKQYR